MNYEAHTIRKFRGTNFGIIRLNELSRPNKMKILIGGIEIRAIGYDTYGHPIISESDFLYYKALQYNYKRSEKTFMAEVWYEPDPFCIRRDVYDSIETIQKIVLEEETIEDVIEYINEDERKKKEAEMLKKKEEKQNEKLSELKKLLVYRKRAAFLGADLKSYLLYKTYILSSNGHIYFASDIPCEYLENLINEDVIELDDKILSKVQLINEVHVPSCCDVCAICGKRFTLNDVKENLITENERVEKVHRKCNNDFTIEVELNTASQIIDAVYDGIPDVEITTEWDDEDKKEKRWYHYKTNQGTISIRFKHKVIVIEWHDNFKPFNMKIFDEERVTKYDRGIHAWSKDDAIRYLSMAKKA